MSKQTQDHIVDVNKKVTAVNWLFKKLWDEPKDKLTWYAILEQAKEMEKQQIIDFADNYVDNCVIPNENMAIPTLMDVPNYYKQTYGNNNGE
jgi:hypothetical protein